MKLALFFIFILLANSSVADIKKELPKSQKTMFGLVLEDSNKQDILSKFGKTKPWHRKDEKHDPYYFCYKIKSKKPAWIILSLGWAWSFEKFNSVKVTYNKNDIKGNCKESSVTLEQLKTKGGIWLSMSKQKALKLISDKPTIKNNTYTYSYNAYEKYKEPKRYPTSTFVYIGEWHYGVIEYQFKNNSLESYYIWVGGESDW